MNYHYARKALQQSLDNGWSLMSLLPDVVHTYTSHFRWRIDHGKFVLTWRNKVFHPNKKYDLKRTQWSGVHERREFNLEHVLLDRMFNRHLWGDEQVNSYGEGMTALRIHFAQKAVEYGDKLYSVDDSRANYPWVGHGHTVDLRSRQPQAITDTLETTKVEIKLEDMWHTIPVRTHRLESIEWSGVKPAWVWHMERMLVAVDLLKYLRENL